MNREELWEIFAKKNPQFNDGEARFTMTASGVRKLFDTVFTQAHNLGYKNGASKSEPKKDSIEDMFGQLFKNK